MQTWYTVPTEVGQARYGSDFSNYERITAYHNTDVRKPLVEKAMPVGLDYGTPVPI